MGATASKVDGPLETLDADQVHAVVAGFGTQFAGAADKMREAGIDGDYLAHAPTTTWPWSSRNVASRNSSSHCSSRSSGKRRRRQLCGNHQCRVPRQFFTKSFLRDDARPGSDERQEAGIATPSSRRRVDGVEDDAMIQHERAVKF